MCRTNFMRGVVSTTALVFVFIMMSAVLLPHVMGISLTGPDGCHLDIPDAEPVVVGSDFDRDVHVAPGDNANIDVDVNVDLAAVQVNLANNPGVVSGSAGSCGP
ncbi:hypothetical protein MKX03_013945 [Papaver bracteatum]|nr:hypothetical protein MKX03_013945 [Papaver bracteatum]